MSPILPSSPLERLSKEVDEEEEKVVVSVSSEGGVVTVQVDLDKSGIARFSTWIKGDCEISLNHSYGKNADIAALRNYFDDHVEKQLPPILAKHKGLDKDSILVDLWMDFADQTNNKGKKKD